MASYYNKVVLMATVSADPQHRKYGETVICDFTVVMNEKHRSGDDWKTESTFVEVTCFNRTAESVASTIVKGDTVMVEGRLKQESWEKDGVKHHKLKVYAEKTFRVNLLTKKEQQAKSEPPEPPKYSPITSKPKRTSEEIPF